MNVPINQKASHESLGNTASNMCVPLSGSFWENSINVNQPTTSSASSVTAGTPIRNSYGTAGAVELAGLDHRNSLDDKSFLRNKGSDGMMSGIDDTASVFTESDAGSSHSSMYSQASGILSDVRPSFVTLARQRNEILLSQQLSQQNLIRIMEELKAEVPHNPKDSKLLFEYSKACLAAGEPVCFSKNDINLKQYIDEGFTLLRKVASNGHPEAHFFLGEAYADDGKDSLAYSQFLSAAKRGYAPACHAIGIYAEIGKGCKKNLRLALEMYTKAATAGSLESMYRLGCAEMKGELKLKKDPVKATRWLKRAAAGMVFIEVLGIYDSS